MKRLFALSFALMMALITVLAPGASAENIGNIKLTMNSVDNVNPGETFDILLEISGDYKASGMHLSIEFDPNGLELVSAKQGDFLKDIKENNALFVVLESDQLAYQGKIKLAIVCASGFVSGSGDLLKMQFKVKSGVTVNQQVVMVIHECVYLPQNAAVGIPIPFETKNSIITLVGGSEPGGGYNDGDTGIGDNKDSSPSQGPASTPTKAPDPTPGGNTAAPSVEPTDTANPVNTDDPVNTGDPVDATASITTVPPTEDATGTAAPDASTDPAGASEAPEGTESSAPEGSGEAGGQSAEDKKTEKNNTSWVLPVCIACGCAAVASAVIVMIKKRKK